jgi:hypothetical protein
MSAKIIGAGLSGLIAACHIPDIPIHEAGNGNAEHKALLRFRSEAVAQATGIPFKPVTVHKAIQYEGTTYMQCTPRLANLYAEKVIGFMSGDRSIWNLKSETRYIAPEDFHERLVHRHRARIRLNTRLDRVERDQSHAIISTIPLPAILAACGLAAPSDMSFQASPIQVSRYRLRRGSDLHQTIYFPQPNVRVYRASITGDLLIIEQAHAAAAFTGSDDLGYVCSAFGISPNEVERIEQVNQRYGKIVNIDNDVRRALLHKLSVEFNVFSIGRFACWRNILLDDIIKDIGIVQKLIAASAYDRRLVLAK